MASPNDILELAQTKSAQLTASDAAFITVPAGKKAVILSMTWKIVSGTSPTLRIDGDTGYPSESGTLNTPAGEVHQHQSQAGLLRSGVGSNIGVTVTGTTPVIDLSVTYVILDASGRLRP